METRHTVYRKIKMWRKAGRSYDFISEQLGISKAEARRWAVNKKHKPGIKVAFQLGIKPVCPTCNRTITIRKVKQPAPKIGFGDWINYYLKKEIKCI